MSVAALAIYIHKLGIIIIENITIPLNNKQVITSALLINFSLKP